MEEGEKNGPNTNTVTAHTTGGWGRGNLRSLISGVSIPPLVGALGATG